VWAAGTPTPPAPTILAVHPLFGTATDRVFIDVIDATGVGTGRLDGLPLTGFINMSGTRVSGRVPAHPFGAGGITVSNGVVSVPFINAFSYTRPTARLGTSTSRLGHMRLGVAPDVTDFTSRIGTLRSKLGNIRLGTGT
jgi:hypothetical protein